MRRPACQFRYFPNHTKGVRTSRGNGVRLGSAQDRPRLQYNIPTGKGIQAFLFIPASTNRSDNHTMGSSPVTMNIVARSMRCAGSATRQRTPQNIHLLVVHGTLTLQRNICERRQHRRIPHGRACRRLEALLHGPPSVMNRRQRPLLVTFRAFESSGTTTRSFATDTIDFPEAAARRIREIVPKPLRDGIESPNCSRTTASVTVRRRFHPLKTTIPAKVQYFPAIDSPIAQIPAIMQ